jgi:hypothetical protein
MYIYIYICIYIYTFMFIFMYVYYKYNIACHMYIHYISSKDDDYRLGPSAGGVKETMLWDSQMLESR